LAEKTAALEQTETQLQTTEAQLKETEAQLTEAQTEVAQLGTQLEQTEAQLAQINLQLEQRGVKLFRLTKEYERLETTAEMNKFFFYYVPPGEQKYGLLNLEECLSRWHWKEEAYKLHAFDCSEMSAALERILENDGFHTVIVAGDSPDGTDAKHAWLLVEVVSGEYMPVEATAFSIVYWGSPYFDNYFKYERQFETIQEALAYGPTEFDWWEL